MLDKLHNQGAVFSPEMVNAMSVAYDRVRNELHVASTGDPLAEIVAQTVIDVAKTGVRDPERLVQLVLARLRL